MIDYEKYFKLKEEKNLTWKELADVYNKEQGESLTWQAFRQRAINNTQPKAKKSLKEYEITYADGSKEMLKKIKNLTAEEKDSPEAIMNRLGYSPDNWKMINIQLSEWEQQSKEEGIVNLYAVKLRLKPLVKDMTLEESLEIAQEVFAKNIKPLDLPKKSVVHDDTNLMIECPGIELHLGKLAHHMETGENYDYKIARERFETIIEELLVYKEITNADELMISIGNDFFNSDTVHNTTTAGTPQQNDVRWQKMFLIGLEMYMEAFLTLRKHFSKINANLVHGNHDVMSSFYLYTALKQAFLNDEVINFSEEYKKVQVREFGNNAIFTSHGDFKGKNYTKLIQSIAFEYPEVWGRTKHRELHLGHLHTELVVDEQSGLIVRRIGSPSGTDAWHYENRFIGSRKVHQFFLWHKEYGMINSHYAVFENNKKKVLSKRRDSK